ncbi:hypothetical protein BDR26DRAFT_1013240 [Obelidium mucronatum]|nr:hypothetical protein BDR26DRAFT_1013240 [Obelidium mucronatum]
MIASDTTFNISTTNHSTKILSSLRNNSEFADVLLLIGQDEAPMLVHSNILACSSEYYNSALSNRWCPNDEIELPLEVDDNARIHVVLAHPDVEVDVMNCVLDYLYTGAATIPQALLIKVALFANQYLLDGLKFSIDGHLTSRKGLTSANALECYCCSERLGPLHSQFEEHALDVMAADLKDSLAMAKLLEARSHLSAAHRWEILVSWSKVRQSVVDIGLVSDLPSDFDKDAARTDMKDLVNLVGVCDLSCNQYVTLVEPIQFLLPETTREFIQAHFSRKRTPESTCISNILDAQSFGKFMLKLTGQINGIEPENTLFAAKLLFRASTAKLSAASFHAACDGKTHTVTLIKHEDGKIVGGYGDAAWHCQGEEIPVQESFIFSVHQDLVLHAEFFHVQPHCRERGMFGCVFLGPTFYGLEVNEKHCMISTSYLTNGETFLRRGIYEVVEYEVFQLS